MVLLRKCMLLVIGLGLIQSVSFGQFHMKDNTAYVVYGISGNIQACITDAYGHPATGTLRGWVEPPASSGGSHFHDNTARPNIVFTDTGGSSFGPVIDNGCYNIHVRMPNFAGQYYVSLSCDLCVNDALDTFNVRASLAPLSQFPVGGFTGIEPTFPGDLSLVQTSDMAHGQLHKYGNSFAIQMIQNIGFYYYTNLGYPLNSDHRNWLQLVRISLPLGGWLDDVGTVGFAYWYFLNPDPHGDGNQADFIWMSTAPLQNAFTNAVARAGCTVNKESNYLKSDAPLALQPMWHVQC